jgi:parvulin-like peptidyl-prolyl isomerase
MIKIVITLFFATLLSAELVDGVAVVVKGSPITLFEVKEEMQLSHIDAQKAVDVLIRKKLEELEISEKNINVSTTEVYEDIKQTAQRNSLSVTEFYDAVREANGLSSEQLKEKIKERLLAQKLYSSIAYSSLSEPSDAELKEYYELHKEEFVHPSSFSVVIYGAQDKERLNEKISNIMLYAPDVQMIEQTLAYEKISPELAGLLQRTSINSFTPIVPDGKGGYMSFYVKEIVNTNSDTFEASRDQIVSKMMAEKRDQVLSDYFDRLRHNANIVIVRMP